MACNITSSQSSGSPKVGFSLEIEDLPNTDIGKQAYEHESTGRRRSTPGLSHVVDVF